jgi:hypothetical protein
LAGAPTLEFSLVGVLANVLKILNLIMVAAAAGTVQEDLPVDPHFEDYGCHITRPMILAMRR